MIDRAFIIKALSRTALAGAMLGMAQPAVAQNGLPIAPVEAYAQAAAVADANLSDAIHNGSVDPHWMLGGRAFWYRRWTPSGPEWVVVESASGKRSPAFDTGRLRTAISAGGSPAATSDLMVTSIVDQGSTRLVLIKGVAGDLACSLPSYICKPVPVPAGVGDALPSPDGKQLIVVRDSNLWLVRPGQADIQITNDGAPNFAYGERPESSVVNLMARDRGKPVPPSNVSWSPDGRFIVGMRVDDRAVGQYPYVQWNPSDGGFRPKLWLPRIPILGDKEQGRYIGFVIDVAKHESWEFTLPDGLILRGSNGWANGSDRGEGAPPYGWSADGNRFWSLGRSADSSRIALAETDVRTRQTHILVEDVSKTNASFNAFAFLPHPNVRILESGRRILWYSERDGWGRLYLYGAGQPKDGRPLTATGQTVRDIVAVDTRHGTVFYTSGGRDTDPDPYFEKIYAVSLSGGAPRLLTPEEAVHSIRLADPGNVMLEDTGVSPDGRVFVETRSTVNEPPVTALRSATTGHVISVIERADVSEVDASGWRPPVRVKLVAADNKTPLWGTVFFPPAMVPGRKYPVIDAIYGGPYIALASADYPSAVNALNPISRSSLARLGFIVVTIDGRGTAGRSKAFNDVSYRVFADPLIEDQIAGLRQLRDRYGNLDLDRVGIYGHSLGGYVSARATLTHPEFFKVCVSSAGPYLYEATHSDEYWFGPADFGGGSRISPHAGTTASPYRDLDLPPLASHLTGKLMLVYGDLDENAHPGMTMQLAAALENAGKNFDLLYLPNQTHGYFRTDAYYAQRMWNYFVENLGGQSPPPDFRLAYRVRPPGAGY